MAEDPDALVTLTDAPNPQVAEMIRAALEYEGITAFAFTAVGHIAPWDFGSTRPNRVQVRAADLERARVELAAIEADMKNVDWSLQDVGEPEPGELAAAGPGTPGWSERHAEKRSAARTLLLLATVPVYGLIGAVAVWIAAIRSVFKKHDDAS